MATRRKLGWLPDRPDFRDLWYSITNAAPDKPHAAQVDLRKFCPPVYDQGELGSCTAQAIAGMLEFNRRQQGLLDFFPSRLFIYYNERSEEGTVATDAGAYIRTGIKTVAKQGYAHEDLWPYDATKFKKRPPLSVYRDAAKFKALAYHRLDNTRIDYLKNCLNQEEAFVFGAAIYESFYEGDNNGGIVPMPKPTDKDDGGHCMMCVGYDDAKAAFLIRNSWGTSVGEGGYYWIPYDYMTNAQLCDDFWVISTVS